MPLSSTIARKASEPVYDTKLFIIIVSLMFFNVLDIHFTMVNLSLGAVEFNPLINNFLQDNFVFFMGYKLFFAGAAVLLFHSIQWNSRYNRIPYFVSAFYSCLTMYQIMLFLELS